MWSRIYPKSLFDSNLINFMQVRDTFLPIGDLNAVTKSML